MDNESADLRMFPRGRAGAPLYHGIAAIRLRRVPAMDVVTQCSKAGARGLNRGQEELSCSWSGAGVRR